jgi:hypothetical protein
MNIMLVGNHVINVPSVSGAQVRERLEERSKARLVWPPDPHRPTILLKQAPIEPITDAAPGRTEC